MATNPPTKNNDLQAFLLRTNKLTKSVRSKSQPAQQNIPPLQQLTSEARTQNLSGLSVFEQGLTGRLSEEQQIRRIASQLKRDFGDPNKVLMELTTVHPGYQGLNPQQALNKLLSTYMQSNYQKADPYLASIEAGYDSQAALAIAEAENKKPEEEQPQDTKTGKTQKPEEQRKIGGGGKKPSKSKEEPKEEGSKQPTSPEEQSQQAKPAPVPEVIIPPRWDNPALNQTQETTEKLIKEENKRAEEFWKRQEAKNDALFARNRQKMEEAFKSSREKQERLFEKPRQIDSKFYSFGNRPQTQSQNFPISSPYSPAQPSQRLSPQLPPPSSSPARRVPASLAKNFAKTAAKRYFLIPLIIAILVIGFFIILYPIFDNLLKSIPLLPAEPNTCFNQGGSCPSEQEIEANSQDQNTCKFLNPGIDIYDSSRPAGLQAYIDKYKPIFTQNYSRNTRASQSEAGSEFDRRLDYILTRSKQVGLNPALFLGLWISENGLSQNGEAVKHMGCMSSADDFYSQVDCATAISQVALVGSNITPSVKSQGYSFSSACASPKNPNRAADCAYLEGIRSSHPDIYLNDHSISPFNNPIQTFDEWEESFGPHSPILNLPKSSTNNNCIHSYNLHIQIAELAGACKQGPVNASSTSINSCKFYRADQTSTLFNYSSPDVKASFKGCPEGFRCEPGLAFSSPKLISYIDKVAKDTGVPASLLGAIVRIEATVPQHDSSDTSIWVQSPYTISDYTDADIDYTEQEVPNIGNDLNKAKNAYIPNTTKAVCPYSSVGALGIMQMYSRTSSGDDLNILKKYQPDKYPSNAPALTVADYCDPLNSLYLGSGLILRKMGGTLDASKLNDAGYISEITDIYFGANAADGEQGKMYEDSLYQSTSNCQASQLISQTTTACYGPGNQRSGFQYFCQGSPSPWADYKYACQNMAYAGCGPTAMAMVLATFGNNLTPQVTAKDFTDHRWDICNGGTFMEGILNGQASGSTEYLKNKGVTTGPNLLSGGSINLQAAKATIDSGGLIIGSGSPFPSCNCDHIVVIDNVDVAAGTVHVQDPICKFESTENVYPAKASWWNYAYPLNKI